MRALVLVCVLVGLSGIGEAASAAELDLEQLSIYPGEFSPDPLIVKKGEPVTLLVTTRVREHVNRISILPWVAQSERLSPGKTTVVEFTPDEVGDFVIRNVGHGFALGGRNECGRQSPPDSPGIPPRRAGAGAR